MPLIRRTPPPTILARLLALAAVLTTLIALWLSRHLLASADNAPNVPQLIVIAFLIAVPMTCALAAWCVARRRPWAPRLCKLLGYFGLTAGTLLLIAGVVGGLPAALFGAWLLWLFSARSSTLPEHFADPGGIQHHAREP